MSEVRDDYFVEWSPKTLREKLAAARAPDAVTHDAIRKLIEILDLHRPLGKDGLHGSLHTPTCGCEDKTNAEDVREQIAQKIDSRYKDAADHYDADGGAYFEGEKHAYDISEQIARGEL